MMICLTFDTDWMTPHEMQEFLERYPDLPRSTFFIHEASADWRPTGHEWGPHPSSPADDGCLDITNIRSPDAVGIRSHSCAGSHLISLEWARQGYLYQSNETRLYACEPAPIRTAWGIWELPIYYMDNMDFWFARNWPEVDHTPFSLEVLKEAIQGTGTYVFDFHPLHIALNSTSPESYAAKRAARGPGRSAWNLAPQGPGVREYFETLLQMIRDSDVPICTGEDAVRRYLI